MRTQEQIKQQEKILDALKNGKYRKVWVVEHTSGTVGVSERTEHWHLVDFDKCATKREAITFCLNEQDPNDPTYFAYPAFAPIEEDYDYTEGGEGDAIPAADSLDELIAFFTE